MLAAVIGLAIGPAAIAELAQQLAHRVRAERMAHPPKCFGEFDVALGDPQQRSHRVAERDRLDQATQILQQRWILGCQPPPPAPGPAGPPAGRRARSFSPRSMGPRPRPVARDTATTPPRPTDRASAAANRRRPRSSNWSRIAAYRSCIARSSIMPPNMAITSGDQIHT